MMRQLLYFSVATRPMDKASLHDLWEEARRLNAKHDVTGYLLFVDGHFAQCIEGPGDGIGQLIENIEADSRNMKLTVLLDQDIEERSFPEWSMGYNALKVEDLRRDPRMVSLRNAEDLGSSVVGNPAILTVMKDYYRRNIGYGP